MKLLAVLLVVVVLIGLADFVDSHVSKRSCNKSNKSKNKPKPKMQDNDKCCDHCKKVYAVCTKTMPPPVKACTDKLQMKDIKITITIIANFYTYTSVSAMLDDCKAQAPNAYALIIQLLTMAGLMKGGEENIAINVKIMFMMVKSKVTYNSSVMAKLKPQFMLLMKLSMKIAGAKGLKAIMKCLFPAFKAKVKVLM